MTRIFLLVLILIAIRRTTSECVESFITVCDNVEDIYKSKIDVTLKDVMVKSKIPKSQKSLVCLPLDLFFNELKYAHSITFVQQLNGFCGMPRCFQDVKIEYMTFLNNNLRDLNYWFLKCRELKKLALISNKMKTIGNLSFRFAKITEIDLTDNEIEIIRRDYGFNNSTKVLIFKSNKLTLIQPRSLPPAVKYLDLSHNELTGVLETGIFDELQDLQYLYLSHNKIKVFPDLSKLTKLRLVDISYNKIFTIEFTQSRKPSAELQLLNLSHNDITNLDFIFDVTCENSINPLEVALHFNLVKQTRIEEKSTICNNSNRTIYLSVFGNPWSCREFDALERKMAKYQMKHSCCDGLHLSSGKLPYCIAESPYDIADSDVIGFLDAINNRSNFVECNLSTSGNCNLLSK